MADRLDIKAFDNILDVSTGTADVALILARKMQLLGRNSGQPITGLDPSANMLSIARSKVEQTKLSDMIKLVQGDAQNMHSLKSNTFEKVTQSFGIRNVPDRLKALKEIHRVMKSGGKAVIMEFFSPLKRDGYLDRLARVFVKYFVPTIGAVISGGHTAAYNHLSDSIFNFPSTEEFKQLMLDAGFAECHIESVFFNVVNLCICSKK